LNGLTTNGSLASSKEHSQSCKFYRINSTCFFFPVCNGFSA
jgi:hypothetical protein